MPLPRPFFLLALSCLAALPLLSPTHGRPEPADAYRDKVVPFLNAYCVSCHDARRKSGDLDLTRFDSSAKILEDFRQIEHVVSFVRKGEMPPAKAKQPPAKLRAEVLDVLEKALLAEARKLDGDPGVVPPRRLTNAEYDNTIHDLIGFDVQPARSFPIDPASGEGFDNTGEALVLSPNLFKKYFAAAELVANHALLTTQGVRFAPHPVVTFADRQKYAESAILDFYARHAVSHERTLAVLWLYRHSDRRRTVEQWAGDHEVSPRYARLLWEAIEGRGDDRFVLRWLRQRWAALPAPKGGATLDQARSVVRSLAADAQALGRSLTPVETPAIVANAGNGPIDHLARRRRTAETRDRFDGATLAARKTSLTYRDVAARESVKLFVRVEAVEGDKAAAVTFDAAFSDGKKKWPLRELLAAHAPEQFAKLKFGTAPDGGRVGANSFVLKAPASLEIEVPTKAFALKGKGELKLTAEYELARADYAARVVVADLADADPGPRPLISPRHPAAAEYAASADAFCRLFPNRFYHADETRGLSAGFHLIEGFFRDDRPLVRSVLTEAHARQLDQLWRELYYVTGIWEKMLRGFVFFERSERNFLKHPDFDEFKEEDPELVKDETLARFEAVYLRRSKVSLTGDALAAHPVRVFFTEVRDGLKAHAKTLKDNEAVYQKDLLSFAERAHRRPLSDAERTKAERFFASVSRDKAHGTEAAVRASLVRTLVSPHFCMRFTPTPAGDGVAPLGDLDLASRLSYFVWAGPPDDELLALAKAGKLRDEKTLRAQVSRMTRDPKVSRFAREFFGQWLGYRDFPTQEAVNRTVFPAFDDGLRQAMYEEPTRLISHLIREGRPITELLDGDETFVNRKLAAHYGLPYRGEGEWQRVGGLRAKGRGGVMGMAVFLTKNSQPQRTSPVKRGFWVVHKLLGEHIPPPPPDVAVLPAKETDVKDKTMRQLLKLHVEDARCARCHERFDPVGLAMEGFDPIGRARSKDMAGRAIDDAVELPDGKVARGVPAFADHLAKHRRDDFARTLATKFLGYALGRSLQLSDQPLLDRMLAALRREGYALSALFDVVASSPQFRTQRRKEFTPAKYVALPSDRN